jgi:polar amino acid transport system substrate-binding protein
MMMIRLVLSGATLLGVLLASPMAHAGELPAAVKSSGVLHLSINATYPPLDFKDPQSSKLTGFDVDLGDAVARRLGVRIEWTDVPFAQLIPSLTTSRTDFILSAISDLPARRETMDFIDYLKSGAQFYVLSTSSVSEPEDLCGKRVGTIRSTSYLDQIVKWSAEHCEGAGRPVIEVAAGESSPDVRAQLKQGRIDAAVQGSETIPYISAQEGGVFKMIGPPFTTVYYGIAFRKDDTALRDAVADTLAAMMQDGTYQKILETWHLTTIAVPTVLLNGDPRG